MRRMTSGRWAIVFAIITAISIALPFIIGSVDDYAGLGAMIIFIFFVAPISAILALIFAAIASFGRAPRTDPTSAPQSYTPIQDGADPVAGVLTQDPRPDGAPAAAAPGPAAAAQEPEEPEGVSRMAKRLPYQRVDVAGGWTLAFGISAIVTLIGVMNLIEFLQVGLGILTFCLFFGAARAWLGVAQYNYEGAPRRRRMILTSTASVVVFIAMVALTAQSVNYQAYREDVDYVESFTSHITDWHKDATLDLAEACLGETQRGDTVNQIARISELLPEGSFPADQLQRLRDDIVTTRENIAAFDTASCESEAQRFSDALAAIGEDAAAIDWETGWYTGRNPRDLYEEAGLGLEAPLIPTRSFFTLTPGVAAQAAEQADIVTDLRSSEWDAQDAARDVLAQAREPFEQLRAGIVLEMAENALSAAKNYVHDAGLDGTARADELMRLASDLAEANGYERLEAFEKYAYALAAR